MKLLITALLCGACSTTKPTNTPPLDAPPASDAPGLDAPASDAPVDALTSCPHRALVFLQQAGGQYAPGNDDSRTNRSPLLSQPVTVPSYPNSDFTALQACIASGLGRFAEVTTTDPGTVPHIELVLTTVVPGLASAPGAATQSCTGNPNGVAFLAGAVGSGTAYHCGVALGLFGLINTLSYTLDPTDFMSASVCTTGCSFADRSETCGDGAAQNCACTDLPTQNSAQILAARLCQ